MPEITQAELNQFTRYQALGTPAEVETKISKLEADNRDQREELRTTKEKLPKSGEVIVKKEEADALTAYKELGDPKEVKKAVAEGTEAKKNLHLANQRTAAAKFVKAAGLAEDTIETLIAMPQLQDAIFEVKKEKVKDAKNQEVETEVGYLTLPGKDEKAMSFTAAQEKVPALKGLRMAESTAAPVAGKPFIKQGGPTGAKAGETVLDRIKREATERQEAAKKATAATSSTLEERMGMKP